MLTIPGPAYEELRRYSELQDKYPGLKFELRVGYLQIKVIKCSTPKESVNGPSGLVSMMLGSIRIFRVYLSYLCELRTADP